MKLDYYTIILTNIVSLIEDDDRLLGEFLRDDVSDLGVQEVVVAVHNNVRLLNLVTRGGTHQRYTRALYVARRASQEHLETNHNQ